MSVLSAAAARASSASSSSSPSSLPTLNNRASSVKVIITNDDGPPGPESPFILPFLRALQIANPTWEMRVVIPNRQKSWVGKGFQIGHRVTTTLYDPNTATLVDPNSELAKLDNDPNQSRFARDLFTLLDTTPAACVNIALSHQTATQPPDLVISGPNFGRNSSAGSSMSSGTVGAALDAAMLGVKAIALSYAFLSRDSLKDPTCLKNTVETSVQIVSRLWQSWPTSSTTTTSETIPDLYNVNVPLLPTPPSTRKILFTSFQKGGYESLFKRVDNRVSKDGDLVDVAGEGKKRIFAVNEKEMENAVKEKVSGNGLPEYVFRPRFPAMDSLVVGSDSWAVFNEIVSITPMKAKYHCIEGTLEAENTRIFPNSNL
ncbi:hypothetical protein HDU76_008243 [Blyttiomyces sp. JEL0837]|nr:hypothetical protein HDU76_008243 [Blyttiomyces sp. JEL0837]